MVTLIDKKDKITLNLKSRSKPIKVDEKLKLVRMNRKTRNSK